MASPNDRLLVAAACRSGTAYTSAALRRAGLVAGHESVFHELGFRSWGGYEAEVSCWVPHYIKEAGLDGVTLVHQMRDPLKSIASNAAHWEHLLRDQFYPGFRRLADQADHRRYPRLLYYKDPVEKALAYFVYQTEAIERLAPFWYKVEELDGDALKKILHLAMPSREFDGGCLEKALAGVDKTHNQLPEYVRRKAYKLGMDDMPDIPEKAQLTEIRRRYGYE